jgi:hypothetical protein
MTLYVIFRTLLSDKSISTPYILMAMFPTKAFWNIENMLLLCDFLLTMNCDEDIACESFSFKILLWSQ